MTAASPLDFHWLQPDLAVGGAFPVDQALRLATEHGIGAVVDLREEACDDAGALAACGIDFLHLPTPDQLGVTTPKLDAAVAFVRRAAVARRRTLIHCRHGIGRSAVAALCVLADRGVPPLEALTLAKDAREQVSPSASQHAAWCAWLQLRTPFEPPSYHAFGCIAYRHLAQA